MADLAQATERTKNLRLEFETVAKAASKRSLMELVADGGATRKKDFKAFAIIAGLAEQLLAVNQPTGAKIALDGLKNLFDRRAATWSMAAQTEFAQWTGREEQEAKRYEAYSAKVADVLTLL